MFKELCEVNKKPNAFEFYTADELWANEHTSKEMLGYHLNESIDVSSRNITFIDQSVTWIEQYFNLSKNSNVLDFGCGPGLYTIRLAKMGINVTGVDFSKHSLEYARKIANESNLQIDYNLKNYLEFETDKKFDLIIMIMCDFCTLSPAQRKIMLGKFRNVLKPDGFVLLDVYSLSAFNQKQEMTTYERNHMDNFWSPNEYYCFINNFKYEENKVTLDKYTIVEQAQTRVVYNWLQHFSREAIKAEFESAGLEIDNFFGDVCGNNYETESKEFAIVARTKKV